MRQENHITPKLGVLSVLILSMLAIGIWGLYRNLASLNERSFWDTEDWEQRYGLLAGGVIGILCSCNWICCVFKNPFVRWTVRLAIVFLTAQFMNHVNSDGWIQNALDLSGIVIFQAMVFWGLKVPPWEIGFAKFETSESRSSRQFSIGDMVIATALVAILLAIATRLKSPVNAFGYWDAVGYWAVLLGVSLIASLIAASIAKVVLSNNRRRSAVAFLIAGSLSYGAVYGLATAELSFGVGTVDSSMGQTAAEIAEKNAEQFARFFSLYGTIVVVFLIANLITAIAGWLQAKTNKHAETHSTQVD